MKSFKDALIHFFELCDSEFQFEDTVRIFAEMKEKGHYEHANEIELWRGNNDRRQVVNRIYLVDYPLRLYVVETIEEENSQSFQGVCTERWVYVPES